MENKKRDIKRNNILQLLAGLIIIILVNFVSYYVFTRFDLTSENRYTLSKQTKQKLIELDDIVYFQVYLDGDFPAGFKRLKRETREMLDQFRAYTDNIQYEFINPSASDDNAERNAIYQLLIERGLRPTDLTVKTNEGSSKQIIFPGAIVSYKNTEIPLELLISQMGVPPEEVLNNSIQNLEFNLVNSINKLTENNKPKVAFTTGHGELGLLETADIISALSEYYILDTIRLNGNINSLTSRQESDSGKMAIRNNYDAIIIAKPDSIFAEKDKFIIDQFIMRGGKVLWLIDPVFASMDSIQNAGTTIGVINDINITDQLFNYGIRLNTNLVMDINALSIPVQTGMMGGTPQYDFYPWFYFPILYPVIDHPIVKNLNALKTEFVSSIDTVPVRGVEKTVLLTSSVYSRTVNTPVIISLDILQREPDKRLYNKPDIPVAVLLEGKFESLFFNRIPPQIRDSKEISFVGASKPTKMLVVADGDIIKNQIRTTGERPVPLPLGFDRYTGQTFGNKDFILNAMNYLIDDGGLITIRSRELKIRLLDKTRISKERVFWQVINTVLPVTLILLLGVIMFVLRRRKFTK